MTAHSLRDRQEVEMMNRWSTVVACFTSMACLVASPCPGHAAPAGPSVAEARAAEGTEAFGEGHALAKKGEKEAAAQRYRTAAEAFAAALAALKPGARDFRVQRGTYAGRIARAYRLARENFESPVLRDSASQWCARWSAGPDANDEAFASVRDECAHWAASDPPLPELLPLRGTSVRPHRPLERAYKPASEPPTPEPPASEPPTPEPSASEPSTPEVSTPEPHPTRDRGSRRKEPETPPKPEEPPTNGPMVGPDDPPTPSPRSPIGRWRGFAIGGGVMMGLGVASLVASLAGGVRQGILQRRSLEQCQSMAQLQQDCDGLDERVTTLRSLSIATAVVGAPLLVVGTRLLIDAVRLRRNERLKLTPSLRPEFLGLTVSGRF